MRVLIHVGARLHSDLARPLRHRFPSIVHRVARRLLPILQTLLRCIGGIRPLFLRALFEFFYFASGTLTHVLLHRFESSSRSLSAIHHVAHGAADLLGGLIQSWIADPGLVPV